MSLSGREEVGSFGGLNLVWGTRFFFSLVKFFYVDLGVIEFGYLFGFFLVFVRRICFVLEESR